MKYKVVGILDILLSISQAWVQLSLLLFVYPKLFMLYKSMDVELPIITRSAPLISFAFLLIYCVATLVGVKLLMRPDARTFKVGVVALVFLLITSGLFVGFSVLNVVTPIYTITSTPL